MKTRKQKAKILFIGRGPFAVKLRGILEEECKRVEVPTPDVLMLGSDMKTAQIHTHDWDLCFVVTPPQAHEHLLPVLWMQAQQQRGGSRVSTRRRPIWVEKPFCSSAATANRLVEMHRRYGSPATYVDFTHLQDPLVEVLKHRERANAPRLRARYDIRQYTPRKYMKPEWDWGAHAHAMGLWTDRPTVMDLSGVTGIGYTADHHGVQESNFLYCSWSPDGKGLQRGIREMLATVYGTPIPGIMHPNWNLHFAASVTAALEEAYGRCAS